MKEQQHSKTGIKDRLTRGFMSVAFRASIAAIVGCIAIFWVSARYDHVLKYYGFSQGDIGKAMTVFSEARSALRAVIGYDDDEGINKVRQTYDEKKAAFDTYMAEVEKSIVTEEGREAYDKIVSDATEYWALSDAMMKFIRNC